MLPDSKRGEQSVGRDHIGATLGFEIPESGLRINGLIGGLKGAVGQIHGAILGNLMKALEDQVDQRDDTERSGALPAQR